MKKLATLLVVLSLGLFTIGCGGGDTPAPVTPAPEGTPAPTDPAAPADGGTSATPSSDNEGGQS